MKLIYFTWYVDYGPTGYQLNLIYVDYQHNTSQLLTTIHPKGKIKTYSFPRFENETVMILMLQSRFLNVEQSRVEWNCHDIYALVMFYHCGTEQQWRGCLVRVFSLWQNTGCVVPLWNGTV